MAEYKVEMRRIRKTFGTLVANNDIDLGVRQGTIHAVIGENGAGKSTLMSILSGVQQADSGSILLDGVEVALHSPTDAVAHGIGMVYQEFMQFSGMTVLENIMMGYEELHGPFLDKKKARARLSTLCADYGFELPLDARVEKLPVATLQQVEIVKMLYRRSDVLILDEPTSVLTPQGIQGLFAALRGLAARGNTIIIITHKLREVLEIADEITVLKDGCVTGRLLRSEADEHLLARLIVGRDVMLEADKPECHPGEELLRVSGLSVRDGKKVMRVRDAAFAVRAGEIVGVCGVAGSGQSELVSAITGTGDCLPGAEIICCGRDIRRASIAERRRSGMGYVPQDRNRMGVNRRGTIWETAYMGRHIASGTSRHMCMDHAAIRRFTEGVMQDFQVKAQGMEEHVSALSGGNVQKLLVGRELSQDYRLLVIEDPTRGIDIGAIEFIWKKILAMAERGCGILLVSHELGEIMQLSDRILVMYQGELTEVPDARLRTEKEIGLYMLGGTARENQIQ